MNDHPRERAGIEVRELTSLEELRTAGALFGHLWSEPGGSPPLSAHVMKALCLSGNYVSGAFSFERLVGASVAWGGPPARRELHSHVTGVDPRCRRHGVGLALKQHQRAWALERGFETITWTFDPLVRRNAVFNLRRLGAAVEAYFVNLYGAMDDELNGGEESDRLLVGWHLSAGDGSGGDAGDRDGDGDRDHNGGDAGAERTTEGATEGESAALRPAIVADAGSHPVTTDHVGDRAFLVEVPEDVERLRRESPAVATAWRQLIRTVVGGTLAGGGRITGLDASGRYVVERAGARPPATGPAIPVQRAEAG